MCRAATHIVLAKREPERWSSHGSNGADELAEDERGREFRCPCRASSVVDLSVVPRVSRNGITKVTAFSQIRYCALSLCALCALAVGHCQWHWPGHCAHWHGTCTGTAPAGVPCCVLGAASGSAQSGQSAAPLSRVAGIESEWGGGDVRARPAPGRGTERPGCADGDTDTAVGSCTRLPGPNYNV